MQLECSLLVRSRPQENLKYICVLLFATPSRGSPGSKERSGSGRGIDYNNIYNSVGRGIDYNNIYNSVGRGMTKARHVNDMSLCHIKPKLSTVSGLFMVARVYTFDK